MAPEQAPRVELLGPAHDRGAFACGSGPLDRYLREQATQDARRNVARTYVAIGDDARTVAGYYTLSATGLFRERIPEATARKLPRHEILPAVLVGRLAVDRRHQGQGLGSFLVIDALARVLQVGEAVAVFAVVVDAIDDAARAFYERHWFRLCPGTERALFLTVSDAARFLSIG